MGIQGQKVHAAVPQIERLDEMSIFKVKAVVEVDSHDLAKYLGEKMGVTLEFGGNNDSAKTYNVSKGCMGKYDEEVVGKIQKNGWVEDWHLGILLNYAADNDWVVEGEYVVQWSW